jgi:hypothetical protein
MIYQYFNINPIRIINQEILLLTGPKKREADNTNGCLIIQKCYTL